MRGSGGHPPSSSGAMKPSVPNTIRDGTGGFDILRSGGTSANPRSSSVTCGSSPSLRATYTLSGFTSRWTIPSRPSAASGSSTWSATRHNSRHGIVRP